MVAPNSAPSGARESGAGDQFHFLWAARRAIELLDPSSNLKRVVLEGFSPEASFAADPNLLLGADLVEYYGGDTYASASQIIVTQLKYSHRQPARTWTAYRMCTSGRGARASVTKRLAEVYTAMRSQGTREQTLNRLALRLVSNQPVSDKTRLALEQAKVLVRDGRDGISAQDVIDALPRTRAAEITRLKDCAGLHSRDFLDFLLLLDLSHCGAESRSLQELRLSAAIARHLPGAVQEGTDRIYRAIESEALPEGASSRGLAREDILVMFKVHSEAALTPVPSKIEAVEDPIETPDVDELAAALVDPSNTHLIAHGVAGVGKTTTISSLEDALPPNSAVIIYDCFGAGSYLEPSEGRHLPQRAVFQMVNELAMLCGTPLLLRPPDVSPELWTALKSALEAAALGLHEAGGVLVLVVDAADNSAFAARQYGDRWFLPELWQLALPEGVRLLVTARTHRVSDLEAPEGTSQLELHGFDEPASATFLRRRFPAAGDDGCLAFHDKTGGNPRVQFYVLDERRSADLILEEALEGAAHTPEAIFEDLLKAAVKEVRDQSKAIEILGNLVCSARPVRLGSFSQASRLSIDEGRSFCQGLEPGVVIRDDVISFRDEDFESHLRSEVGSAGEIEAHQRLSDFFSERDETDAEAATVLAEHLYRGQRYRDLIDITLDRAEPMAITDPVVRLQVYKRRLTFALRAALIEGRADDSFRLTVLAAEAARSNSAVESIIREVPDLAMRHGDPSGVAEVYLRQENQPWRGPVHLRISAMYARAGHHTAADEHFAFANAWLREAIAKKGDDADEWRIAIEDIAVGSEAVYWRHGLGEALGWLRSWRPGDAVFAAINRLANTLALKCDPSQLEQEVSSVRMSARVEAVFRGSLWRTGLVPSLDCAQRMVDLVERSLRRQPMKFVESWRGDDRPEEEWLLGLAEMAACGGVGDTQLLTLIRHAAPPLPVHAPSEWDDLSGSTLALRKLALEAELRGASLTIDDLVPDRLREKPEGSRSGYDPNSEERRRYREVFGDVLPAFVLRARVLCGKVKAKDVASVVQEELAGRRQRAEARWNQFDRRYRLWSLTLLDAVLRAALPDAAKVVAELADIAEKAIRGAAPSLWLDVATVVIRRLPDSVVLGLADRAAVYAEEHDQPATERVQTLLRVAALMDTVDSSLAQDYYDRAVTAAAGIDDDSVALLELHTRLAGRVSRIDSTCAEIAARMVGLVEEFELKVSDPDRLPRLRTIRAVASLHPQTAFATVSRWDDEDRLEIDDSVTQLVHGATTNGFLWAETGVCLLQLGGDRLDIFGSSEPLLTELRQRGPSGRAALTSAVDELSLRIRRDLALWARPAQARRLADWGAQAGLGAQHSVAALRELAEFAEGLRSEPSAAQSERLERVSIDPGAVRPPLSTSADLSEHLKTMAESYASDDAISTYIAESGRALTPADRVPFLHVLSSLLPTDRVIRWYARGVALAIYELVNEWRRSRPVMRWAADGIPSFIENSLAELIGHDREEGSGLDRLLSLRLGEGTTTLLLRAVSASLEDLSAHQLFAVASSVASLMDDNQVREALLWSIGRLESCSRTEITGLPVSVDDTLAAFLFALFGNVDKRKRWRAAHVARSLLGREGQALTDALVAHASSKTADGFMSAGHAFYWLSARQWLYLVLARLADDSPNKLRQHLDLLADAALETELPHASIRDLAKRAALSVHAASASGLNQDVLERLLLANEPASCCLERKHRYGHSSRGEVPELRFRIDDMDTLPYWYSPLADVFGQPTHEVATRAVDWIVDYLCFTEDDAWNDRREHAQERQWQLMNNSHGDVPVLESLDIYLKYHGMLLAAGQMIDEGMSVACDEWDELQGPWRHWLEDYVESSPDWWLSDLRSPAPLEAYIYADPAPVDEWRQVADEDFDNLLTMTSQGPVDLVVDAHINTRSDDRHEYLRVRTALVSPAASRALMRALQSADANDFFLPYEGSDESQEGRREIFAGEFELAGLLVEESHERESIEKHDPLARIRYSFDRPGDAFMANVGARPNRTGLLWSNQVGEVISKVTMWNDAIGDERDAHERQTDGTLSTVPLESMLGFLLTDGRELIIDVEVDRKDDRREDGREREYEPAKSRIYLLRGDGTLENLDGCRSIGRSDCP